MLQGGTFLGKQEGANAPMLAQNVEKFKTRSVAPTTTTEAKVLWQCCVGVGVGVRVCDWGGCIL